MKTDPKARYQGYSFFFREGFCWNLINGTRSENDLKFRISSVGVNDVGGMSLHSMLKSVPNYYIVCLCNSSFMSRYSESYVNFTVNFQINDARQLPIIVPNGNQLKEFYKLYAEAINIQKKYMQSDKIYSYDNLFKDIQKTLDDMVLELYKI